MKGFKRMKFKDWSNIGFMALFLSVIIFMVWVAWAEPTWKPWQAYTVVGTLCSFLILKALR